MNSHILFIYLPTNQPTKQQTPSVKLRNNVRLPPSRFLSVLRQCRIIHTHHSFATVLFYVVILIPSPSRPLAPPNTYPFPSFTAIGQITPRRRFAPNPPPPPPPFPSLSTHPYRPKSFLSFSPSDFSPNFYLFVSSA